MTNIVLLVTGGMLENFEAVLAQKVAGILMPGTKVVKYIRVEGGAVFTHLKVSRHYRLWDTPHIIKTDNKVHAGQFHLIYLAHIRHLSRFVGVLHVLQEHWLTFKGPLTYLTLGWTESITITKSADELNLLKFTVTVANQKKKSGKHTPSEYNTCKS